MDDATRLQLLHGPYESPKVKLGAIVTCEYRDTDVVIAGWTDALFPWPCCRVRGRRSGYGPWVGAGLAAAVRTESAIAVAHWWGVGVFTVRRWRRALGVGHITSGTHALYVGYAPEKCLRPDVQAAAHTPELRERVSQKLIRQRRGKPGNPASIQALLDATGRRPWTAEEDAIVRGQQHGGGAAIGWPHP